MKIGKMRLLALVAVREPLEAVFRLVNEPRVVFAEEANLLLGFI